MKTKQLKLSEGFRIAIGNRRSQAAEMVLALGDAEGGPDNRHGGADQWLFVVEGRGQAVIDGEKHVLEAGTLLLIERGDRHEIKNTGRSLLRTLNVYLPPAYTKKGTRLKPAKP